MNFRGFLRRWLKFNTVGAIGIAVQLAVLAVLRSLLGVNYLVATALAVEAAVLHNFVWHELWTWRDRRSPGGTILWRLVRFNLSNGLVSLVTNLVLMRLLVGGARLNYFVANVVTIATCSIANFLVSDWFVFDEP